MSLVGPSPTPEDYRAHSGPVVGPERERMVGEYRGIGQPTRRLYKEKATSAGNVLRRLGFDPTPKTVTRTMVEALLRDETLAPTTRGTSRILFARSPGVSQEPARGRDPQEAVETASPKWRPVTGDSLEENAAALNHARDERARVAIALPRVRRPGRRGGTGWAAATWSGPRAVAARPSEGRVGSFPGRPPDGPSGGYHAAGNRRCGTRGLVSRFERARLWNTCRLACVSAGIRHLSPHDLRRGYARNYLAATEPILGFRRALSSLRDNMGHEDEAQSPLLSGVRSRGQEQLASPPSPGRTPAKQTQGALDARPGRAESLPLKDNKGLTTATWPHRREIAGALPRSARSDTAGGDARRSERRLPCDPGGGQSSETTQDRRC